MAWQDAVQDSADGIRLLLEVSAGAKAPQFPAGYNEWRARIGIRVTAPAQAGRANKQVCDVLAQYFGLSSMDVALVAGESDARKTLLLRGASVADVTTRLEADL